jgi:uncharacterized integral membrane protein
MKTKTVVILIVIALFAIFLLQNSGMTPLRLYFWNIYAPLFILVAIVFAIGFLAGFLARRPERKKEGKALPEKSGPAGSAAPPKPHP